MWIDKNTKFGCQSNFFFNYLTWNDLDLIDFWKIVHLNSEKMINFSVILTCILCINRCTINNNKIVQIEMKNISMLVSINNRFNLIY